MFSNKNRKGVYLDRRAEEEIGGTEEEETIIGIYYVRKKNLFSVKGEDKNKIEIMG